MKISDRVERKIDRLMSDIEDLSDELAGLSAEKAEDVALAAVEMRDLLDELANDWDLPEFRRNQARDLVRRVDGELGAELADAAGVPRDVTAAGGRVAS